MAHYELEPGAKEKKKKAVRLIIWKTVRLIMDLNVLNYIEDASTDAAGSIEIMC